MKIKKSLLELLVKECIAEVLSSEISSSVEEIKEEAQPEPYDPETDSSQPSPRDRTEPVESLTKKIVIRPYGNNIVVTAYAANGTVAGAGLSTYNADNYNDALKMANHYHMRYNWPIVDKVKSVEGTFDAPISETNRSQNIYYETLDQTLTAIEEFIIKNSIQVDTSEHPSSAMDPHGIREPFAFGGIPYEQNKNASYKLLAYKGKPTRKHLHVNIYRMPSGRYELTVYVL